MEPGLTGALAAVLGSLVGGAASLATAWMTQRTLGRREAVATEIRKRERLYAEFVTECSRLSIDAYSHGLERPDTVIPAYALLNRIRLVSSETVLEAADRMVRRITEQYFQRNLSVEEMRELARSATVDPLRSFSEACRNELKSLRADA